MIDLQCINFYLQVELIYKLLHEINSETILHIEKPLISYILQ